MSNFLDNLFKKSDRKFNLISFSVSLYTITLIRTFFENFSNPSSNKLFSSFSSTFVHYPMSYIAIFFSIIFIFHLFTKVSIIHIFDFSAPLFCLILLTPPIDLFLTHGTGWKIAYLISPPKNLFNLFINYFGPFIPIGITPGMRIEIMIILLSFFVAVFYFTKKLLRSLIATALAYASIFFYLALPSFLAYFFTFNPSTNTSLFLNYSLNHIASNSLLANINNGFTSSEAGFDVLMADTYFIVLLLLTAAFIFFDQREKFIAWLKYFQLKRVLFYFLFALYGIRLALVNNNEVDFLNIYNFFSTLILFILLLLHYWLAVTINDLEDTEIDKINDLSKPLVSNSLTKDDYLFLQKLLVIFIFFGSLLCNYYVTLYLVFFQATYYIYSKYPLKLKRHFLTSSISIGLNCIFVTLAGFYLISQSQIVSQMPIKNLLAIFILIFIISNFKDLKDYKGDKIANLKTLAVISGEQNAKKILLSLSTIIFLVYALFLQSRWLMILTILLSVIQTFLFTKKKYDETYLFLAFYICALVIIFT